MALSRERKTQVVDGVSEMLQSSKLTVMASYSGTTVADLQSLRQQVKASGTEVKVIKNRLFRRALESAGLDKTLEEPIRGQTIYLFNDSDEVAPAQELYRFAKTHPQVEFISGISSEGSLLTADDLMMLASLPSKEELRAQLVGLINAPLQSTANVIGANIRGLLNALSARSTNLESN